MNTLLEVIAAFVAAGCYMSIWLWVVGRRGDKRIEHNLWLTLRRVAYRHSIDIPDGLSVDEAGTYIEDYIDNRIAEEFHADARTEGQLAGEGSLRPAP